MTHACIVCTWLGMLLCVWCGGSQAGLAQLAPAPGVAVRPATTQQASSSAPAPERVGGAGVALASVPRVELLRDERRRLRAVPFELGTPIAMLSVGVGMGVVGFGVLAREGDDCERQVEEGACAVNGTRLVGIVMGVSGAVLALVGATIFPSRLARRRERKRELQRIEGELEALGEQARVVPWLWRTGAASAGGLAASVRF